MIIINYWSHLQHSGLSYNSDENIFCHMSMHMYTHIYVHLRVCIHVYIKIYICIQLIRSHSPPEGRQRIHISVVLCAPCTCLWVSTHKVIASIFFDHFQLLSYPESQASQQSHVSQYASYFLKFVCLEILCIIEGWRGLTCERFTMGSTTECHRWKVRSFLNAVAERGMDISTCVSGKRRRSVGALCLSTFHWVQDIINPLQSVDILWSTVKGLVPSGMC